MKPYNFDNKNKHCFKKLNSQRVSFIHVFDLSPILALESVKNHPDLHVVAYLPGFVPRNCDKCLRHIMLE